MCGYASLLAHSNERHVMLLKSELLYSVNSNESSACFCAALSETCAVCVCERERERERESVCGLALQVTD